MSTQLVADAVRVGCRAPSAHNSQPWLYVLMRKTSTRTKMVDAMLGSWSNSMREDGRPEELISKTLAKFRERFTDSPLLLLCCVDHSRLYYDRYADESRRQKESLLGHHSLAAAVQNILIYLSAAGLGACWYSAPLFCAEPIRKAVGLPRHIEPAALITIGNPPADLKPKPKRIRPLGSVLLTR